MIYQEYKPDNLLKDFIKCYWQFNNSTNKTLDFTILPDGCFDLIISLDNYSIKSISLTGLWTKQIDISIPADTHLFAIRFRLLAAEYILQQNISTLLDTETEIDNTFLQLHKLHFDNSEKVTELLNNIFLAKLGTAKGVDSRKKNYSIYFTLQMATKQFRCIQKLCFGLADRLIVILLKGLVFH